ncbi:hypothetical protein ACP49_10395 [Clostridium botulinum]|nr:hypothetical protein NZ45_01535 [Clostridium botulinum]KIN80856.1 hypothetical protein SD74_12720 [Clostridium botulinum]KOM97457.1 hypothetical protein ACP53_05285 [Clostridium botulinum]KON00960.1 hypothetical protein ACP49_10395 [Clostridium botulinum]OPD35457.1 hypothetical protein AL714_17300 [Clostridium botulinum]
MPPPGRKFLMEQDLELLSKMNWFMSVFFIFGVLNLNIFMVKYLVLISLNFQFL